MDMHRLMERASRNFPIKRVLSISFLVRGEVFGGALFCKKFFSYTISMISDVTFITGNPKKVEFLTKYIGLPIIAHHKADLDELQSLSLREIVEHKVKQGYTRISVPPCW